MSEWGISVNYLYIELGALITTSKYNGASTKMPNVDCYTHDICFFISAVPPSLDLIWRCIGDDVHSVFFFSVFRLLIFSECRKHFQHRQRWWWWWCDMQPPRRVTDWIKHKFVFFASHSHIVASHILVFFSVRCFICLFPNKMVLSENVFSIGAAAAAAFFAIEMERGDDFKVARNWIIS